MLLKLLRHVDRRTFRPCVYSLLSPAGALRTRIEQLEIEVREVGFERGLPNPLRVAGLVRALRRDRPDLVQTWMYHSDLIGGIAARLACIPAPVVWNIRNNTLDASSPRRTFWVVGACARLSHRLPDAIVCCSQNALQTHAAVGYDRDRFVVIPNGFDLSAFRPNPGARAALRQQLGLSAEATVIGLVARFDPQKDHRSFLDAAGRLHAHMPDVQFVLCGSGITRANTQLTAWIDAARLNGTCHLLGERHDVADVTAALDIACSSSQGEAFPNAVGEAMACEVPCVVTEVGDSAYIVGNTGYVIPPRDPAALVEAWKHLLARSRHERETLGRNARRRVAELFAIASVVRAYEEVYRRLATPPRRQAGTDASFGWDAPSKDRGFIPSRLGDGTNRPPDVH